jgi:hypothetical protein
VALAANDLLRSEPRWEMSLMKVTATLRIVADPKENSKVKDSEPFASDCARIRKPSAGFGKRSSRKACKKQ